MSRFERIPDEFLEIPAGNITGYSSVNKFGENPDIAVNTTEDVWDGGGTYSFPTTATITHIRQATDQVGTDANATIEIQGLDASWNLTTQTADLDGTDTTTEVVLGTALIRVFRMKVLENIVGAADIWVGATGMSVGTANAIIQAGNNQTLMAIYTIPNGKTGYLTNYYCDNETDGTRHPNSARFKLWIADRDNTYEFQLKHSRSIPELGNGIVQNFKPYMKITQKSDIKISCTINGSANEDGHPHAGFDLILVDN